MPTAPATPSLPQVSFVNLYSEDPWKKRQRVRIQQACSECRRQKIKCDGQKPCKSCKKSDRNCVYNAAAHASGSASPANKDDHHENASKDDHMSPSTSGASVSASTSVTGPEASNATNSTDYNQQHGQSSSSSSAHPHSSHPYSKHQHTVHRNHSHVQHIHHSKDGHVKQEPVDHVKPSPLRKDSKHDRKGHDHNSESKANKMHVKDIGKYGVPLDEWQKQDESSTTSSPGRKTRM
ncbi:hypothetical protein BX616_009944 [Lobosporangium transversale]|nr:hypothetical protein BX616_009944 [Lobosporangium transversale]